MRFASEFKFKIDDLVMYAHALEDPTDDFVEKYYMKPAKVVRFFEKSRFPYKVQILASEESTMFKEEELEFAFQTKDELGTLLIKGHIDQKLYEQLIKTIKEDKNEN